MVHNGNVSTITSMIASGFSNAGGASWSGQGIASSAAAADTSRLTAIGSELNNDGTGKRLFGSGTTAGLFDGLDTVVTDVILKYTYFGDATLDGQVDGSDYNRIDASQYGRSSIGWSSGDFNYDGSIDATDYSLIDNAFNNQGGQL